MLKYLWILTALVALGSGPVYAQKQEAVLQHVQVPNSGFDLVLATPRAGARALADLGNIPDAFVVHLHGGRLVAVFEDAEAMLKAMDSLRSPVFASEEGASQLPIAIYAVAKGQRVALSRAN